MNSSGSVPPVQTSWLSLVPLALRNLVRHKGHSAIMIFLFTLATVLFLLGHSVLYQTNQRLEFLFTHHLTSDYLIAAEADQPMGIFGTTVPSLEDFVPLNLLSLPNQVEELLQQDPNLTWAPILSAPLVLDLEQVRTRVWAFGVDFELYNQVLPDLVVSSGAYPPPGVRGILLSKNLATTLEQNLGRPLQLGEELLLTGVRADRFRLRPATLSGIIQYPMDHETINSLVILDNQTLAELLEVQVRSSSPGSIPGSIPGSEPGGISDLFTPEINQPLDLDDLFQFSWELDSDSELENIAPPQELQSLLDRVLTLDLTQEPSQIFSSGSPDPHFFLVRGSITSQLSGQIQDLGNQVIPWRQAAGQSAMAALVLQSLFFVGFGLFLLALVLGATNTIYLSVFRRTRELGTMAALGFSPKSLAQMMLLEHLVLGLLSLGLGLGTSLVMFRSFNQLGLVFQSRLASLILGSGTLSFYLASHSVVLGALLILLSTLFALIPPLVRAMNKPLVLALKGTAES